MKNHAPQTDPAPQSPAASRPGGSRNFLENNRVFAWIAAATGLVLLVPLIAMRFTSGVNWGIEDFAVMGLLLFATGGIFVLAARRVPRRHRFSVAVVCALGFGFVWLELAVGVFTNMGS